MRTMNLPSPSPTPESQLKGPGILTSGSLLFKIGKRGVTLNCFTSLELSILLMTLPSLLDGSSTNAIPGTSWDIAPHSTSELRSSQFYLNDLPHLSGHTFDHRTIPFHGLYWFFCYQSAYFEEAEKLLYHMGYSHSVGLVKEPNKVPNHIWMILSSTDSPLLGK